MELAKCRHCGKLLHPEDTVYTIYVGDLHGEPVIAPTCSEKCAREETDTIVNALERKIAAIRAYKTEKMLLKNF